MTLTELHADPKKLAAFMGWPYGPETKKTWERTPHLNSRLVEVVITAEEATERRWREYRDSLKPAEIDDEPQWRYVRRMLADEFGMKCRVSKAAVAAAVRRVMEAHPEVYQRDEVPA